MMSEADNMVQSVSDLTSLKVDDVDSLFVLAAGSL